MVVNSSDLTALARIRDSALELFAARGIRATSIRDVARAAGVSAGTVQHYFASKDALRAHVNEHVTAVAAAAFTDLDDDPDADPYAITEDLGRRITGLVESHPHALRYVARCAADGEDDALALFDGFVDIATSLQQRAQDAGLLHTDLDRTWAALNVVVVNLATIMLERAISRHLPAPFFSPESLERWRRADTDLFRRAFYRDTDAAIGELTHPVPVQENP